MITITNKTGGQLVCTLTSGETLRLDNNKSTTIKESEITKHLKNLILKGKVLSKVVPDRKKKESIPKKESKVKED